MKCAATCACAEELAALHGERLTAIARRQGLDAEDARDAVQEAFSTFIDLSQAQDLCARAIEDGSAFLTAVVVNVARNMRRRHHRAKPHLGTEAIAEIAEVGDLSSSTVLETAEEREQLYGCLDTLDDVPRQVVALRIFEDLSGTEVAKRLELSPENVAVILHRAKRSLSLCIRQTQPSR
jgi:RNA polymerase sigma-70 factor (ECF subfamily)